MNCGTCGGYGGIIDKSINGGVDPNNGEPIWSLCPECQSRDQDGDDPQLKNCGSKLP